MIATAEARNQAWQPHLPSEAGFVIGVLQQLRHSLDVSRLPLPNFRRKPRRWDSSTYFNPETELSADERWTDTFLDLLTFFDEYVGMLKVKLYEYGPNGLIIDGQSYSQSAVQVCRNNERQFEQEGRKLTRAKLETRNAEIAEPFLLNPESLKDQALVVFSPKGGVEEKYPGKSQMNYSFINVLYYDSRQNFKQFTNFDTVENLNTLHQRLQTDLSAKPATNLPPSFPVSELGHQLIAAPLLMPIANLPQIETLVFENADDWKFKLVDLPEVDGTEFEKAKLQVAAKLQQIFHELLTDTNPAQAAKLFDHLVDDITYRHFLKWVEDHATNYQELLANQKLNIRQRLRQRFKRHLDLDHLSLTDRITTEFELELAKKAGTATSEQLELLKQLHHVSQLNPALPLHRLSSLLHCVVGTPASLAKEVAKTGKGIEQLLASGESIRDQYLPLVLTNDLTGERVTWYIVKEEHHKYVGKCRYENGIPLGPCGVNFDDDEFVLSETQYNTLVEAEDKLARQKLLHDSLASNPAIENVADHQAQLHHIEELLTKILYKDSIGFGEMLSGSVLKPTSQIPTQWLAIGKRLASLLDPIKELPEIIAELEAQLQEDDPDETVLELFPKTVLAELSNAA